MNRKSLLCATALVGIGFAFSLLSQAHAADLPSRKAAPVAPVAASTWTGFYAGVEAGSVFGIPAATVLATGDAQQRTGVLPVWTAQPYALPGQAVLGDTGFFGGARVGYNYQINKLFLVGLEADMATLFGSQGSQTFVAPTLPGQASFSAIGRTVDSFGSGVARFGVLPWNDLLIYVAGGMGFGHANLNVGTTSGAAWNAVYSPANQGTWRTGWVAGGGAEWAFATNWSVSLDYRHFDLGTANVQQGAIVGVGGPVVPQTILAQQHFNGNLVKLGLNFRFSGLAGMTGNPVTDLGLPAPTFDPKIDGAAYDAWLKSHQPSWNLPSL